MSAGFFGGVHEIAVMRRDRRGVGACYYADEHAAAARAAELAADEDVAGVYVSLNPTSHEPRERLVWDKRTEDSEITRRRWLLIDFDPRRPSGTAATDAQVADAAEVAAACEDWLVDELGWPLPLVCASGNGIHHLYRVDLPADAVSLALVSRVLSGISERFSSDSVSVDRSVGNAARLTRMYGTINRKGRDASLWRPSGVIRPTVGGIVTPGQLALACGDDVPAARIPMAPGGGPAYDVEALIAAQGWRVTKRAAWNGGTKWVLGVCPFDASHTDRAAFIGQREGGALAFRCHHNGCAGRDWHALRERFDPKPAPVVLTIGAAPAVASEPGSGHAAGRLAENELAALLAPEVGRAYRYHAGEWWGYGLGVWSPVDTPRVVVAVSEAIARAYKPAHSAALARGVTGLLSGMDACRVGAWAERPGFANGVVVDGVLQPHAPENLLLAVLPFDWDPEASSVAWEAWLLERVGGERRVAQVIQAFFACILRARGGHDQFFLELVGPGGTGKSSLMTVATWLVGDAACYTSDLDSFEESRFEASALYGKLLAVFPDQEDYGGTARKLKRITGGDPIKIERKGRDPSGSFVFRGMVILTGNQPLRVTDYSSGFGRRRISVPFMVRHHASGGIEWLRGELAGIYNWALELDEAEAAGVLDAARSIASLATAREDIEAHVNTVAGWAGERLAPDAGSSLRVVGRIGSAVGRGALTVDGDALYPDYTDWCKANGRMPVSAARFGEALITACESWGWAVEKRRGASGYRVVGVRFAVHVDV